MVARKEEEEEEEQEEATLGTDYDEETMRVCGVCSG